MEIKIHSNKTKKIAELISVNLVLRNTGDFLDLMGNASYQGAESIIISSNHLPDEFFDLKTGFAGEVLQKFSNYSLRLAIVGDFSDYKSKSLKDFIRESNRTGRILFLNDKETAIKSLS